MGKALDSTTDGGVARGQISFSRPTDDTLLVRLSGSGGMQGGLPSATVVQHQVESGPRVTRVAFETQGITAWDSGLVTFLVKILAQNRQNQIETDQAGLPEGVRRLLALATAVPEREGAARVVREASGPLRLVAATPLVEDLTAEAEEARNLQDRLSSFNPFDAPHLDRDGYAGLHR